MIVTKVAWVYVLLPLKRKIKEYVYCIIKYIHSFMDTYVVVLSILYNNLTE